MNRSDIVALVRDRMGFKSQFNENIILRHMEGVQNRFESGQASFPLPWFMFNAEYTTVLTIDQGYISYPTNFVKFDDSWGFYLKDSDGIITPVEVGNDYKLDRYAMTVNGVATGKPSCVTLKDKIYLHPVPDKAYTLYTPAYIKTTNFKDDEDNPWFVNFPMLILEETLDSILRSNRDSAGIKLLRVNEERSNYLRRVEEMEHILQNTQVNSYNG